MITRYLYFYLTVVNNIKAKLKFKLLSISILLTNQCISFDEEK